MWRWLNRHPDLRMLLGMAVIWLLLLASGLQAEPLRFPALPDPDDWRQQERDDELPIRYLNAAAAARLAEALDLERSPDDLPYETHTVWMDAHSEPDRMERTVMARAIQQGGAAQRSGSNRWSRVIIMVPRDGLDEWLEIKGRSGITHRLLVRDWVQNLDVGTAPELWGTPADGWGLVTVRVMEGKLTGARALHPALLMAGGSLLPLLVVAERLLPRGRRLMAVEHLGSWMGGILIHHLLSVALYMTLGIPALFQYFSNSNSLDGVFYTVQTLTPLWTWLMIMVLSFTVLRSRPGILDPFGHAHMWNLGVLFSMFALLWGASPVLRY